MKTPTRTSILFVIALVTTAPASVLATESQSCIDKVTWDCYQAMKDASYLEKFALGVLCGTMIAACLPVDIVK